MRSELEAYHELCGYTLTHSDPAFIHQLVVDAFAAQHATEHTKPIAITFALVGLYLRVERGFTGRQVQLVHMRLAQRKHSWPAWTLPADRGAITAAIVLASPPGAERDRAIDVWCASVWQVYRGHRQGVVTLLSTHGISENAAAFR